MQQCLDKFERICQLLPELKIVAVDVNDDAKPGGSVGANSDCNQEQEIYSFYMIYE